MQLQNLKTYNSLELSTNRDLSIGGNYNATITTANDLVVCTTRTNPLTIKIDTKDSILF